MLNWTFLSVGFDPNGKRMAKDLFRQPPLFLCIINIGLRTLSGSPDCKSLLNLCVSRIWPVNILFFG